VIWEEAAAKLGGEHMLAAAIKRGVVKTGPGEKPMVFFPRVNIGTEQTWMKADKMERSKGCLPEHFGEFDEGIEDASKRFAISDLAPHSQLGSGAASSHNMEVLPRLTRSLFTTS
jgi:hypothetical protein